jgi:GNAT superfamily N-acetyltransferase
MHPSCYTIRPAGAEDLVHLPAIELAAGELFVEAGVGGTVSAMSIPELESALLEGGRVVATGPRGLPVGFVVLKTVNGSSHIAEMDVHPQHGRKGLGGALLHAVVEQARAQGHGTVTLTTYADLPWNGPFYARRGFVVVPCAQWTPSMAALAAEEGVAPGSGRVLMQRLLR